MYCPWTVLYGAARRVTVIRRTIHTNRSRAHVPPISSVDPVLACHRHIHSLHTPILATLAWSLPGTLAVIMKLLLNEYLPWY